MNRNIDTEVWQSLGEQDADWAVESRPERKHGGWAGHEDEFYETGRIRVQQALDLVPGVARGKVIDWGSGTGRLSFTLAEEFDQVTCVDISSSFLAVLAERAKAREIKNLDLRLVGDFKGGADHDFALSLITMQHFPDRETVRSAIEAMIASLRPGAHMVIEIPASAHTLRYRLQPRVKLYRFLRRLGFSPQRLHAHGLSGIKMLCIPREWVVGTLESAGAPVTHVSEYRGTSHQLVWYVAQKTQSA